MAKIRKSTKKKIIKAAKKHPVVTVVVFLLVVAIVACCVLHYKRVIHIPFLDAFLPQEERKEDIITDELSIHFLELGVYETGDCTLIKTGNTEVLIDAGATRKSAPTIKAYLERYCEDDVLEYVVATHAHEDHIAGFVGDLAADGVGNGVLYSYQVGTIIQFAKANTTSNIYNDYLAAVEYAKQEYHTTVYTALECWNEVNGAKKSFELAEDITLNVLYQKYYETKSSGENNYSVCTLLSQGNNHYLFTGDLEEAGEKSLADNNDLPKCKLFKAGHHGSKTSSHNDLLLEIQPEIVCVCCCAGSNEYTPDSPLDRFPTQDFIDRVAVYTDKIYVTTLNTTGREFTSMNGDIVVHSNGVDVNVTCSNNDTILKETEWFKKNRTWPENGK